MTPEEEKSFLLGKIAYLNEVLSGEGLSREWRSDAAKERADYKARLKELEKESETPD